MGQHPMDTTGNLINKKVISPFVEPLIPLWCVVWLVILLFSWPGWNLAGLFYQQWKMDSSYSPLGATPADLRDTHCIYVLTIHSPMQVHQIRLPCRHDASPNTVSQLGNELDCLKHCWGVYKQNTIVNRCPCRWLDSRIYIISGNDE